MKQAAKEAAIFGISKFEKIRGVAQITPQNEKTLYKK